MTMDEMKTDSLSEVFDKVNKYVSSLCRDKEAGSECRRGHEACLRSVRKVMTNEVNRLLKQNITEPNRISQSISQRFFALWNRCFDRREKSSWHLAAWRVIDLINSSKYMYITEPIVGYVLDYHKEKYLWYVPGIVNELASWIDNNSWCIQPRLSVAASLAFLGSLVGRKVKDCYGNRTNLYILGIAPSGSGKQAAIDKLKEAHDEIFDHPGRRHQNSIIGAERWSSDTALVRDVGRRLNVIYFISEIGKILKSISSGANTSAHLAGIITELLSLYDSAKGSFQGKVYADTKVNVDIIREPHVSIYGVSVKRSLLSSITAENITDGFLARTFIVEGTNDPVQQRPTLTSLPEGLKEKLKALAEHTNNGFDSVGWLANPCPKEIVYTPEATELLDKARGECITKAKALGEVYGVPYTRLIEKACRLALIYAVSEAGNVKEAVVTKEAFEWAYRMSWELTEGLVRIAADEVGDTEQEKTMKKMLAYIRDNKKAETLTDGNGKTSYGWITRSNLINRFQRVIKYARDAAVDTLLESGQLEEYRTGLLTAGRGGKSTTYYRIKSSYERDDDYT